MNIKISGLTTRLHISPFRACGDMGQSPIIPREIVEIQEVKERTEVRNLFSIP